MGTCTGADVFEVHAEHVECVGERTYAVTWCFYWPQADVACDCGGPCGGRGIEYVAGAPTTTLLIVGDWGVSLHSEDVSHDVWNVIAGAAVEADDYLTIMGRRAS
jgi:hypothetical protein